MRRSTYDHSLVYFLTKGSPTEADWPWVFSALSFDPLVWESLGVTWGRRALGRPSNRPEDYSPAAWPSLALELPGQPRKLRGFARPRSPPTDNTLKTSPAPSLAQAGLGCFTLREAWRESGAWEAVFRQISSDLNDNTGLPIRHAHLIPLRCCAPLSR